jgi:hypothetical protein
MTLRKNPQTPHYLWMFLRKTNITKSLSEILGWEINQCRRQE